jgi:hypothetical protein
MTPSLRSHPNHPQQPISLPYTRFVRGNGYGSGHWLRHLPAGSPLLKTESGSLSFGTTDPPRAAPHPVSRRRSCLRLLSRCSSRDDSDFHWLISYMCVRTGMAVSAVWRLVYFLAPCPSESKEQTAAHRRDALCPSAFLSLTCIECCSQRYFYNFTCRGIKTTLHLLCTHGSISVVRNAFMLKTLFCAKECQTLAVSRWHRTLEHQLAIGANLEPFIATLGF